ncbi:MULTISPECIES: hypothetical protein [unclassified Modestobacter]|uniref:hypothetical protein n=1 Tax=unclassified Modestobacter TaxID=2643866 RepID=UPI0022AAE9D1|nr:MULTISPECIES: hypothetical protein [unclassified Modestobacter]MCZ2825980.1 hypothetical protein [Modestobacter sp. VKM Ac-2981]MCZ2852955.1 hypothetical protein [Modestobacter sp. VKM Ac-2982]
MTDPEATDADRLEQQRTVAPAGPELADEVSPPGADVPEADAVEQQLTATPGTSAGLRDADPEADEYDVLEQQAAVPDDEDEQRG